MMHSNSIKAYTIFFAFVGIVSVSFDANIGVYYLLFFLSVLMFSKNIPVWSFTFLFISALGLIITIITFMVIFLSDHYDQLILLRLRYWILQVIFSLAVYIYFRKAKLSLFVKPLQVVAVFYLALSLWQSFSGLGQFGERAYLLVNEPSQAAGVVFFLLTLYIFIKQDDRIQRIDQIVIGAYVCTLLLIGSKANILLLASMIFFLMFFVWGRRNLLVKILVVSFAPVVAGLFYILYEERIHQIANVLVSISANGLEGLSYEYGVWDSYIIRISGWLASIDFFIKYPLGIGAGGFHVLYPGFVYENGIPVTSKELSGILEGALYSTPKSYYLELIVSTGVFGLIILFMSIVRPLKYLKNTSGLFILYLTLILHGFVLELAPYLAFQLAVIAVIDRMRGGNKRNLEHS